MPRLSEAKKRERVIAKLVKAFDGTEEDCLDMIVHDVIQDIGLDELNNLADEDDQEDHISALEDKASDINNEGQEAQIRWLIENGVTEDELMDALGELSA